MARLLIPTRDEAHPRSQPLLDKVEAQLGTIPNLFALLGVSPPALEGFLGLSGALAKTLDAGTRERVAIAIAQANGCDYCLSAHTWLGVNKAGLSEMEVAANRGAGSDDPKADAALQFAAEVLARRGKVSNEAITAVRDAGFDDAQIVDLVAHVAVNVFTNYLNNVARTPIDFPAIYAEAA